MSLEIVILLPAFNCIALDADGVAVVVCEVLEDAKPPPKIPQHFQLKSQSITLRESVSFGFDNFQLRIILHNVTHLVNIYKAIC